MALRCRNMFPLFCVVLFWELCTVKAYLEVCDRSLMTLYCNCNPLLYRESNSFYKVNCVVLQNVSRTDPVWRSIGDSETIYNLKLYPRLPLRLEYIPSEELKRMPNLKYLSLEQGSFGTLKPYTVSGFESLVELDLSSNEITALEANAISNLPKLKKLMLSENKLQEVLADSLSNLFELEMLFLDRNNISRIETCAFCSLQNLKELELWGNQISDLTEYTFRGLRYLKRLDLYKNKIRILNDKVFHSMPRLAELELKENLISHIASRTFYGLEKLQMLTLASNKIKVLPDEVFLPLVSLRSLDLYRNEIEVLQSEVINNIKNSKDEHFYIAFKDNPLKCDCAMQWMSSYINENLHMQFKRELEAAKCTSEDSSNHTVLDFLKTVDCKSSTIKPRAPVFIPKVVEKSTDSIPIELQSQKSKTLPSTAAAIEDSPEETYFSDSDSSKAVNDNSGCESSNCDLTYVAFASLVILFFDKYRMAM